MNVLRIKNKKFKYGGIVPEKDRQKYSNLTLTHEGVSTLFDFMMKKFKQLNERDNRKGAK